MWGLAQFKPSAAGTKAEIIQLWIRLHWSKEAALFLGAGFKCCGSVAKELPVPPALLLCSFYPGRPQPFTLHPGINICWGFFFTSEFTLFAANSYTPPLKPAALLPLGI